MQAIQYLRLLLFLQAFIFLNLLHAEEDDYTPPPSAVPTSNQGSRVPANVNQAQNGRSADEQERRRFEQCMLYGERNEAKCNMISEERERELEMQREVRRGGDSRQDGSQAGNGNITCEPGQRQVGSGCVKNAPEVSGSSEVSNVSNSDDQLNLVSCTSAHEATMESCNSNSKSWMSGIRDVSRTLGPAINQINSSMCGSIAAATTGAEGSLATFEVMCNSAMKACVEACKGSAVPGDSSLLAQCRSQGTKAAEAQQQMASAMMTLQGSVTACQNAFGSLNQQAIAHCAVNPAACQMNLPGAIQASTLPSDQAGGLPGNPGLGASGSAGDVGTAGGFNLSDLGDEEAGIGPMKPNADGEEIGGAKGGGSVSGGGGSGDGGPGGGRGGKKEGGLLTNILSGFFGSGGGGSSSGGGGWKSWFGGGKGDGYSGNPSASKGTPDLRQFLPGGLKDPNKNRGIAGQIVGQDGMTGPHSNIWLNIKNRYQAKRASLLP